MRRNLITIQVILVAICAVIMWLLRGDNFAVAALYGGFIAIASTWLLSSRVERAGELAKKSAKWSVYHLLFGAIQRFVFVLVGLALGMWQGALGLEPIPILITFGVAQLSYMIAMNISSARL